MAVTINKTYYTINMNIAHLLDSNLLKIVTGNLQTSFKMLIHYNTKKLKSKHRIRSFFIKPMLLKNKQS